MEIRSIYDKPIVYINVCKSVYLHKITDLSELLFNFVYTEVLRIKGEITFALSLSANNTHDYIMVSGNIIIRAG
jgi:hypothetical protein